MTPGDAGTQDVRVAETDDDPTVAVADTVPWAVPLASCSVNGADEDAPGAIGTELALTDEPPLWVRATSMAAPELATTFWNWSTSCTEAVMERESPRAGAGLSVQLSEPAAPEQVTRAGRLPLPFPTDALVKLRPAARPAVTVSVWVAGWAPAMAAVMTGLPASSSP